MAEGELKDMELFFSNLQTTFTAFESEAYKTSVVGGCSAAGSTPSSLGFWVFFNRPRLFCVTPGLFMRHMLLAYNKLSFSQVYKLYQALLLYYHSSFPRPAQAPGGLPALVADDSDMDLTSTEDTVGDRMDKEEVDSSLEESELR